MLAIEIIVEKNQDSLFQEVCCVTGKPTASPVKRKDVFSGNFGDEQLLLAQSSQWVDRSIGEILKNGYLRWSSWIIDEDGFRRATKADIRAIVTEHKGVKCPWGAYAAEDMRRHGGLLTHANRSFDVAHVQLGTRTALIRETAEMYKRVLKMHMAGVSRKHLDALDPWPWKWDAGQLEEWSAYLNWAMPIKDSPEYALAVWLLPTKEEADNDTV